MRDVSLGPHDDIGNGAGPDEDGCLQDGPVFLPVQVRLDFYRPGGQIVNARFSRITGMLCGQFDLTVFAIDDSPAVAFRELVPDEDLDFFGLPFFPKPSQSSAGHSGRGRRPPRLGWDGAHLVRITDENHCWYDPAGRTIHLLARCVGQRSNTAVLAKVVEEESGKTSMGIEKAPSGRRFAFVPLPGGTYIARIIAGELGQSRKKFTPGFKLTFRVLEGQHEGRQFWHDVWLTEAAMPMAKRDLGKLGIKSIDQLEEPLPQGIRCNVKLVLRKDDDGTEYNRVRSFEVVGIDELERDSFAPDDDVEPEPTTVEVSDGAGCMDAEQDDSFDYGHNRGDGDGGEGGEA